MPALPAATVVIEGEDAMAFAQAQLSSDVRALAVGAWQWSAWLDPQGRVRALLQLARCAERRLLLLLRGGDAAELADALHRYVLRARVDVAAQPMRMLTDGAPLPSARIAVDADDVTFGAGDRSWRIATTTTDRAQDWRLADIRAGYPWLAGDCVDTLLAPSLALQRLGAVNLAKGCYPGQEIVARMHYRGGGKRHLYRIAGAIIEPGAVLRHGDTEVGRVLDAVATGDGGAEALAVIADARIDNGQALQATPGIGLRVLERLD